MNPGGMNRRSLGTHTLPAQGGRKGFLLGTAVSLHIGSLNGFAVWDVGKDFQEEHRQAADAAKSGVIYHVSVTCTTQNHHQRKTVHAKRNPSLTGNKAYQVSNILLTGQYQGQLLLQWLFPKKAQGVCFADRCITVSFPSGRTLPLRMRASAELRIRDGTYWKVQFALKRPLGLVQYHHRKRARFPIENLCRP